jgi:hypothetical protein
VATTVTGVPNETLLADNVKTREPDSVRPPVPVVSLLPQAVTPIRIAMRNSGNRSRAHVDRKDFIMLYSLPKNKGLDER